MRRLFPFATAVVVLLQAWWIAEGPKARAAGIEAPLYEGSIPVAAFSWDVDANGGHTPRLLQAQALIEPGRPILAVQQLNFLVPCDSPVIGIEVLPQAWRTVALPGRLCLAPLLQDENGQDIPASDLPAETQFYPADWGRYSGSHTWRGYRWVSVLLYPVRAQKDESGHWTGLQVLERYSLRLVTDPAAPVPDIAQRRRLVPGERQRLEARLRTQCVNGEMLAGYARQDGAQIDDPAGGFQPTRTPELSGSAVSYLIITSDLLTTQFQTLADHKTAQGLPAVVKTVQWIMANYRRGADIQETVRLFIRAAYENWGVEYVLLACDTDVLPARYAYSTYSPPGGHTDIPTDLYFACLDGNWDADGDHLFGEPYINDTDPGDDCDFAQEILIGRYPVSTFEDAATVVSKVIAYEQAGAGSAWTNRNLFAAEVLAPSNYHPGDTILIDGASYAQDIVDSSAVPCTNMDNTRMYEATQLWPGSLPLTRTTLIDSLNTGHYGIFSQIGHGFYFNMSVGSGNFVMADAGALTNDERPFLIYALNCASAAFDQECLMEAFLQNPHGGAVVASGSVRGAYPLVANQYQQEFFSQTYCGNDSRVGALIDLSRQPFLDQTYLNTMHRWTQLNYVLLGDPSLPLWTAVVKDLAVSLPSSLPVGAQNVVVTVTAEGSPVSGARVCLVKDGEDYTTGLTDPSGTTTLFFVPTSPGQASLTVTARNCEMAQITRPVTVAGAYIALSSISVVDNGSSGSSGNGNGVLEAGETGALWLTCRDTGSGGATGCSAMLSTSTPGMTILDNSAAIGTVPSGGTKAATDPFLVRGAASMTDGTNVVFYVVVTGDGGRFDASRWSTTVAAPEPEPVELIWSDSTFGNGNGIIENGERITIRAAVKNFGAGRLDQLTGRLRSDSPGVTRYDSVVTYPALGLKGISSGSGPFSLAFASASSDNWCRFTFEDNYGRTFRHEFLVRPPGSVAGLATDVSEGPNVIALYWPPSEDARFRGYHVYRSLAPAGPFTRADQDLIEGISYFRDSGLTALRRYYYRVTVVDSSLVEGPPSEVVSQSTVPRELEPFPLPYSLESNGHLAVGDIDGDGMLEIVLGSDEIYVWKSNGNELFDGDHDAQTHGPITDFHSDFQPAGVALAPLVGESGLQIVACERLWSSGQHNAVHVLRADGTDLPGWPQSLAAVSNGWAWATPAVGDVDGDGRPEIVVNTLDSRTWVWHVDGTELRDGDDNPTTNGVFLYRGLPQEWGTSSPALCDLDGDGAKEIIFGSKSSDNQVIDYLHAYRYDGTEAAGFPYATSWGDVTCSPTVADLNNDNIWEIIFVSNDDSLHVVEQDGSRYGGFPIHFVSNTSVMCPSPTVGDMDGDGELEIVAIATQNATTAYLYVIDTDVPGGTSGQTLPGWPRTLPGNSEASPVVGDLDGDGSLEILHGIGGGSTESPNELYAFDAGGNDVDGFPIPIGAPIKASPYICDLDLDGDVDIVLQGWDLLTHVWDLPYPYAAENVAWRTFRGNNYRDGVYRPGDLVSVSDGGAPQARLSLTPYPNPFNPSTTVRLYLPGPASGLVDVAVAVYDLQGRLLRTLHEGPARTGWQNWVWDGRDAAGRSQASGVYFLRARASGQTVVSKMSLIK